MSQPSKWWWGLIPLAILWILATVITGKSINSDLNKRATASLGSAVVSLVFSVAGRDVALAGVVFSPDAANQVAASVGQVWGVRRVLVDAKEPEVAKPFNWAISHEGPSVVLSGSVPNPDTREKIVATAKATFAGADIKDEMHYASGAAAGYAGAVQFGIDQLGKLSKGSASLSDTGLTISGSADTSDAYNAITTALKTLPEGLTLAKSDITAPKPEPAAPVTPTTETPAAPAVATASSSMDTAAAATATSTVATTAAAYGFDAARDTDKLTLSGNYPDDDAHGKILDTAKSLFPGDVVNDQMTAAPGAPNGFANAALAGLSALSRLAKGTFSLAGTNATLSGEALYDGAVNSVQRGFAAALPDGFKAASATITVSTPAPAVDAVNCQSMLNGIVTKSKIGFETGKARVSPASSGLLDTIVATINRCPGSNIEVSGHTDSSGDEKANIVLSEQRAKAVLTYLTDAGVPSSRLTAVGFGSSHPLASNDTEEGKALNRRIEFSVK